MTRNFKASGVNFREPQVILPGVLGLLLLANLVVAAFAFHLVGDTPNELDAQLISIRSRFRTAQQHLNRSRLLLNNMDLSREQGDKFLASYVTPRRQTYTITDAET